jgi:hypothetical protein
LGFNTGAFKNLAKELDQILDETEEEFNQLPVFVRPIARRGLEHKTVACLSDWQHLIGSLIIGEARFPTKFGDNFDKRSLYVR